MFWSLNNRLQFSGVVKCAKLKWNHKPQLSCFTAKLWTFYDIISVLYRRKCEPWKNVDFKNEEKFTRQIWVKISVKLHTCFYNFYQDNFTFFQSTFSEEVFQNFSGVLATKFMRITQLLQNFSKIIEIWIKLWNKHS